MSRLFYSPASDYMRVAIVHDWLNGMRGGEKVLEALLAMFPGATVFTLFHERGKVSRFIESHRIITSRIDRIPGVYRLYRNFLPLFPAAVEAWRFDDYDLVISSSHAVAKGIRMRAAPHICYCHTPMRYIWDAEDDYRMNVVSKTAFGLFRARLQRWDCEAAKRVDHFIANSSFVRERIRRYYGRESDVVPPPIDTGFYNISKAQLREDVYLTAGALVPYKRFDVVVRAFNVLRKRLIVVGAGPESKRLRAMAASNVDVRGWVSSDELRRLYQTARALVYAAREDFGMVAVEAHSCGCPVIAYGAGGLAEVVQVGVNGVLFAEQHDADIVEAVERFEMMSWPVERVVQGVEDFSREAFTTRVRQIVEERARDVARSRMALQSA